MCYTLEYHFSFTHSSGKGPCVDLALRWSIFCCTYMLLLLPVGEPINQSHVPREAINPQRYFLEADRE